MRKSLLCLLLALTPSAALAQQTRLRDAADRRPAANRPAAPDSRPGDTTFTPVQFPLVWDLPTAAHFMRRAGFGALPAELERMVDQGFEATLEELLDETLDDTAMEAALAAQQYRLARTNQNGQLRPDALGLGRWWSFRMVHSRRQLVEKMTFFWHDHFATSLATVRQVTPTDQPLPLVLMQNGLMRALSLGNFKLLIHLMARDPAMLVWLDNRLNVKGHPNENWARELLELFTMGIGNYTEQDIQEAARAFTGWTIQRRTYEFVFNAEAHDFDSKAFLGVEGDLNGDDIVNIVFEQPATAEFIARKLFEFFVYPDPSDEVIQPLAARFRDSGYEIKPLMRAIFTSAEFYSDRARRAHIKSPIELVMSTARELEILDPLFLNQFATIMGQQLFAPPDVGGWTTGTGWINTTTALQRYNFFNFLAINRGRGTRVDVEQLLSDPEIVDAESLVESLLDRFVQGEASMETKEALVDYLETDDDGTPLLFDLSDPLIVDKKVRGVLYLAMVLPLYQLN